MTLQQLTYLVKVAECGNITEAAEQLYISQPSMSTAIIERIHEAAKYVPLDRLYLSPQCGFASCEIGNKLTEEQQWAKLRLVKEIAEEVWDKDGHIG